MREEKLNYWIKRIETDLADHESDKKDVLNFVGYMQEKYKIILWIIRCIIALLQIKKELLMKCNSLKKLDNTGRFNSRISYYLKNAAYKQIGPMSKYRIQRDNNYQKLYLLLIKKEIFDTNHLM